MSYSPQYGYSVDNKYDCLLKLLLIGNSHVGKSCMLLRYTENLFTNNFYNTIGVDFKTKYLQHDSKTLKLQIWDTAGQDRFKTITNNYYRGAHGVMIVFDVTDRNSFENVKQWMSDIDKYAEEDINKILVGNKIDIQDRRKISFKEGQQLADRFGIRYIETSAKTAQNIENSFQLIASEIMNRVGSSIMKRRSSTGSSDVVVLGQDKKKFAQPEKQPIDFRRAQGQFKQPSKGCC